MAVFISGSEAKVLIGLYEIYFLLELIKNDH
jgi:hypothetical protein